ncbi:MAG TPA: cytochrome c biogenesis protein ResB [Bacteroidales bacterium]|nr:cytochrome c biogenesis protein ResB [Bacteroidales bacterium]
MVTANNEKKYFKFTLIILSAIVTAGFLLQWFIHPAFDLSFPKNLYFILLVFITILSVRIFASKTYIYNWLTSVFTSLVAILAFFFFMLLMGLIPQKPSMNWFDKLGLTYITSSFPFILIYLFLLLNLGLVVSKRITAHWSLKNLAFILNHLGLWLVLLTGGVGVFDFVRLDMFCRMNTPVWYGFDEKGKGYELPLALELKQFEMEYFLPQVKLIRKDSTEKNGIKILKQAEIDTVRAFQLSDYKLKVKKYLPYSWWWNDSVFSMKSPGYVASALIEVSSKDSTLETWLAYPSAMQKGKMIEFKNGCVLILDAPIVKRYKSTVTVYTKNEEKFSAVIEVNKPLEVMGWKLYQKDYHKELGEYSDYSIIEANKDEWLGAVYAGVFMMLAGALLLIWTGNKK